MIEELRQKAEKYANDKADQGNYDYAVGDNVFFGKSALEKAYIAGATENGVVWHDLRKNPEDLPKCEENKQIAFYVKEWYENVQEYHKHYCLGFYKKAFLNDDVKLFVEKSKGYESEHLPESVFIWCEMPDFKEE